ncbi:STAS domain-containing protein [Streptomyces sp. NPDC048404]|uniref:STAS domain-containing protein n=1 Tax=unclassified Streptomyces TaxID=2593676 RepID=UPI00343C4269
MSEAITLVTITTPEFDTYTAPRIREILIDLVNQGRFHLVVDVAAVEFFDSGGQGVLVGGLKRVRAHEGALVLVMQSEITRSQLRVTGLNKIFPIFDTVDRAVEFLGRELPAAPERMSRNGAL